jgi:hypothetical protein
MHRMFIFDIFFYFFKKTKGCADIINEARKKIISSDEEKYLIKNLII